jgi:hypothetical protein
LRHPGLAIICLPSETTRTLPAPLASIPCSVERPPWRSARRSRGIGGSLFAQYFLYLDPTYVISPELSFQFALLPAVGGLGTAIGPVLGSFLITPLSELLRSHFGSAAAGLHLVIYSLGLVVVMLYFPSGLAGALNKLTRWRPFT